MGKWTIQLFLLLLSFQIENLVFGRDEESLFSNLLFEEAVDEAQCDQMQMEVSAMDSAMSVDNVPNLYGKWVSQECEVRPGPEFLLRSYTFNKDNSFKLLQHIYEDESCILPWYTIIAKGSLFFKEPSWTTPSGTETKYRLSKVTIISHTSEAAERLSKEAKRKCFDVGKKAWKVHREYIVYKSSDNFSEPSKSRKKLRAYRRRKTPKNIDCLSALGVDFSELWLVRSQWRAVELNKKQRELLLGDIHTERKFNYKPTAFQVPLLDSENAHDCINCRIIAKGTQRAPPYLLSKPQLPPLPHGQWVSQRCEVRPLGMFLTRRLSFDSRDRTWIGEYKYHADPFCTESAFAISVSGKYQIGSTYGKDRFLGKGKTGSNIDMHVKEASLTLYDPTLRDTFNGETECGKGIWYVGIAKDLLPTSGCSILGIVLPSTDYDLIKLEIDRKGTPLLLMGAQDTETKKRGSRSRPTSYQAPLAQCSVLPQKNVFNNHLEPIYYARTSSGTSSSSSLFLYILCIFMASLKLL